MFRLNKLTDYGIVLMTSIAQHPELHRLDGRAGDGGSQSRLQRLTAARHGLEGTDGLLLLGLRQPSPRDDLGDD